jgi:hypothetical protein
VNSPIQKEDSGRSPLGILGFGTGLALASYIIAGISLGLALLVVVAAGGFGGRHLWVRTSPARQEIARGRALAGLRGGLLALLTYDLSRWILVELLGFGFWPFDIFGAFGSALWGPGAQGWWVQASGVAFHVANGLGFAVGYTLLFGKRGPLAGIGFALGLEAAMVALYPGWLRIAAIDEFLQVSMVGHVVYGATLGWSTRRLLERRTLRGQGLDVVGPERG